MPYLAIDIETTGLDPDTGRILTVALAHSGGGEVIDLPDDEEMLLLLLEDRMWGYGGGLFTIVTWNGGGFDLPFLWRRMQLHGVTNRLDIEPTREISKYGSTMYDGHWHGIPHWDIAPAYKDQAEALGVRWSLKPVAEALGLAPVTADVKGANGALDLPASVRQAYCLSDAATTLALAERIA